MNVDWIANAAALTTVAGTLLSLITYTQLATAWPQKDHTHGSHHQHMD